MLDNVLGAERHGGHDRAKNTKTGRTKRWTEAAVGAFLKWKFGWPPLGQLWRYPPARIAMSTWKFTSRSLFAFTTYAALSLASMRVGGLLAAFNVGAVAVFATALAIVAFVDRAGRRAFAIGFLIPLFAYVGIHTFSVGNQLNPFEDSALATTRSFGPLYMALRTVAWIDTATGNVIPDYDPSTDPRQQFARGGGFGGPVPVRFSQTPDQETFTLVAHSIVVVILGLVGAYFAMYIYRTRDGG